MSLENGNQLPPPGVAVPPCRLGRRVAQRVDHRHEATTGGPPAAAQIGVGHDGRGAAQAGQVPGLGRRRERDRPSRGGVIEGREGNVPQAVEQKIGPDLVGDHGQSVPLGKVCQSQQVIPAEDRAGGIVRMTEPEEF